MNDFNQNHKMHETTLNIFVCMGAQHLAGCVWLHSCCRLFVCVREVSVMRRLCQQRAPQTEQADDGWGFFLGFLPPARALIIGGHVRRRTEKKTSFVYLLSLSVWSGRVEGNTFNPAHSELGVKLLFDLKKNNKRLGSFFFTLAGEEIIRLTSCTLY